MCGIVGILGAEGVAEEVVDALKRLDIAVMIPQGLQASLMA